ncbi:hypothetical protein BKA62DRAFT_667258 [Auriculariales sp. MPI-PUGE-AT-0066]|nr:hypothetical protein BKA62DRAFT_667258 [Auriculariales sp. MPI-PUGE-AT-0066]
MAFDRLPAGSWVLVTGATGLVGSLPCSWCWSQRRKAAGFTAHLTEAYGEGVFEFIEVPDIAVRGAFDAHLQGVAGIVHVATDTSLEGLIDTDNALLTVSAQIVGLMKSAARVNTSQILRSDFLVHNRDIYRGGIRQGHRDINGDISRPYAAVKIHGEQEAWKYWKETKPGYAFNTVLPVMVIGPVANPTKEIYSTHTYINEVFQGKNDGLALAFMNPPKWMVDTRDCAAIHVAALLSTETSGERLWAAAHQHTLNQHLALWRKTFPDREILTDFDFPPAPRIDITDREKSTKLLKNFTGRDWYSFEVTALANVAHAL